MVRIILARHRYHQLFSWLYRGFYTDAFLLPAEFNLSFPKRNVSLGSNLSKDKIEPYCQQAKPRLRNAAGVLVSSLKKRM